MLPDRKRSEELSWTPLLVSCYDAITDLASPNAERQDDGKKYVVRCVSVLSPPAASFTAPAKPWLSSLM